MKKYCKGIDITDRSLIRTAIDKCLNGKYTRDDTLEMFSQYSGLNKNFIRGIIETMGSKSIDGILDTITDGISCEITNWNITLKPVWYSEKMDSSSFKLRRIGIQDVKQQIYDYIAIEGLSPFLVRIGEYQCASIKGRGQSYGVQTVRRWLRNKEIKYAGKADIQKCYESIDKDRMMKFLKKHIKNDTLLCLIEFLINTFEKGLSIGSYLSQFLCNLYLSQLYHEISENMFRIRKKRTGEKKRINLAKHVLFYMDDILILGTNAKDVHKAVDNAIKFAEEELGLCIKPKWTVFKAQGNTFIDMMGVRIYRDRITIRRRVFKRIRRCYKRAMILIMKRKKIPVGLARRCIAYYGIVKNTDSFGLERKYRTGKTIKQCRKVVSYESKVRKKAA